MFVHQPIYPNEIKTSFIIFTYMVWHMYKKTTGYFLLSNFINPFLEFIVFLSCHFVIFSYLVIISLCYEETRVLHARCKSNFCFAWKFSKSFSLLHLDQCQLMSYMDNFYVRIVSRVGFLFCFGWWTNQRGLSPKEKKCQGCPPKLTSMNHTKIKACVTLWPCHLH